MTQPAGRSSAAASASIMSKAAIRSLRHPSKPALRVVPVHRRELPRRTLAAVIKQAGLSLEELLELL
jgi:hypothetical protein